jgi:hypothetical protein
VKTLEQQTPPTADKFAVLERIMHLETQEKFDTELTHKLIDIVSTSPDAEEYSAFLTADNPHAFRSQLPRNQQFREEAQDYGINLESYFAGLPENNIKFDISSIKNELGLEDSLLNKAVNQKANEFKQVISEFNTLINNIYDKEAEIMGSGKIEDLLERRGHIKLKFPEDEAYHAVIRNIVNPRNTYEDRISMLAGQMMMFEQRFPHLRNLRLDGMETASGVIRDSKHPNKRAMLIYLEEAKKQYAALSTKIQNLSTAINVLHQKNSLNENQALAEINTQKYTSTVNYFLIREEGLPHDILIGSYGGYWIGREKESLPAIYPGIESMLLDEGTGFFGVYQKIGRREPERTGMVTTFASSDQDIRPVFAISSIHLSETENPRNLSVINPLVKFIYDQLTSYALKSGFKGVAISLDEMQAGEELGRPRIPRSYKIKEELLKLPDMEHQYFYQEMFDYKNHQYSTPPSGQFGWLLRP